MRKSLLVFTLLIAALYSVAQNWNPFVNEGTFTPEILLPLEFEGAGVLSFAVGNTGSSPLHLITNQEMTIIITLSNGIPDNVDPVAAVGGTWVDMFNWNYEPSIRTYSAIQTKEIPANSQGTISIQYKVTANSRKSNATNGFNVNLQPPPYSNGINLTDDDAVSFYTYVQAKDFSDAPASYGIATHQINIFKDHVSGAYENYLFLGSSVDPDTGDLSSANADGDDIDFTNDEDGVTFPILVQGDTANIAVEVTVHDYGSGVLHAWIDWNGNGNFEDKGEKVAGPVSVFESQTINLSVIVPDIAVVDKPTFARFRLGDHKNKSEKGDSSLGEVEDYQIQITEKPQMKIDLVLTSNDDNDLSGTVTEGDVLNYTITVTNTGKKPLTNVVISDTRLKLNNESCTTLAPNAVCIIIAKYTVNQTDADAGVVKNTVTGLSVTTGPVTAKNVF